MVELEGALAPYLRARLIIQSHRPSNVSRIPALRWGEWWAGRERNGDDMMFVRVVERVRDVSRA